MFSPTAKTKSKPWWHRLAWVAGILVLVSVMASQGLKGYARNHGGEETVATKARMKAIQLLLEFHKSLKGSYPPQSEGLEALMPPESREKHPERAEARLKDAWHRRILYRIPGVHHPDGYDLFSLGPDGIEDTEDDITNW